MRSGWTDLYVDGSRATAYVASPDGPGLFPPIVVAMHVFGVDPFVQGKCDELAEAGFVAIAPYLYHRQQTVSNEQLVALEFEDPRRREVALSLSKELRDDTVRRDVLAALDHLRGLPNVGAGPAGITGFCVGGRITFQMAAATDAFGAAAVFYGTDMNRRSGDSPAPLSMASQIRCALAGFFGNEDENPSPADVDEVDGELNRLGIAHTFHRYDGAPHAFNDPFNPVRWTPAAAADAWPKLVAFLDGALKSEARV